MADKKISVLTALAAANATDADLVPVVSSYTGTATNYKMSMAELRKQLAEKFNTGETDHGSIANGNGAIPFLNAGGATAGMWMIVVRSYAGNLIHGAALYVSDGANTQIITLAVAAGGSFQIYATDGKSPIVVNISGGNSSLITSYLKVQ